MANLVWVAACSHSPYLFDSPDTWEPSRARRKLRQDVPIDSEEVNHAKFERCMAAFGVLREKLAAVKPDVLLVFGDDQYEQFRFTNFPTFAICLGEEFDGTDPRVFINSYYPPQPSGLRCYDLGRAVRRVLEALPMDLRVAVLGSGGLWHTPIWPDAYLDEKVDRTILDAVRAGDARRMAGFFDEVPWQHPLEAPPDMPPFLASAVLGVTGLQGGVGSGSGEIRNWIAAAAVADGTPGTVVDYVPVYASPCGMGFAYWEVNA